MSVTSTIWTPAAHRAATHKTRVWLNIVLAYAVIAAIFVLEVRAGLMQQPPDSETTAIAP